MSKRAVLYARVSKDDRANATSSLEGQLELCREYAQRNGWQTVAEVSEDDKGASGALLDLPGLNKALDMARAGAFDVLVTRELDRFSRSLAKQLIVEEELKGCGVTIEYVLGDYPDTVEGSLMKNIRAVVAEYERLKISERLTRGRVRKIKAGSVMTWGQAPYGYTLVEEEAGNGQRGRYCLEIDDPQAAVVRMIFDWYTRGDDQGQRYGIVAIARKLSELKVPTYRDLRPDSHQAVKQRGYGEWSWSTVHNLLRNETYAGTWRYGKQGRATNGRRYANDKSSHILVNVPAIISREQWEAAQDRLKNNKADARRNVRHEYLLRGRVICGDCGYRMEGTPSYSQGRLYRYYRCRGRKLARKCSSTVNYPVPELDAAVWQWVRGIISNPERMAQGAADLQAAKEAELGPLRERVGVIDNLLQAHRAKLEQLLDLYLDGQFNQEILLGRKNELERTIASLTGERDNLAGQIDAQSLTAEQLLTWEQFTRRIAAGLDIADEEFGKRREIIELLNVQVTVGVENGRKVGHVRCYIGEDDLQIVYRASGGT